MRAGVAAFGLLVAVAIAGTGQASSGRTLTVRGAIVSLSAAGPRVAIQTSDESTSCDSATFWTPTTGTVTTLPCGSPMSGGRFADLTLAGSTAIWWDYDSGNHVYCSDVYTTSVAHPAADHGLGICDGTEGDTYFQFAGDSTITAIVDYSVCNSDCVGPNGDLLPDGNYGVEVRRIRGGKVVPLLKPRNFRVFLDARNWRVAVIEPKATLTVYDAGGSKLWSVPQVTGVYSGWIAGNTVVLQQTRSVRVYSANGAGIARPLPSGARLDGVVGGLVAYTTGSTVRLLRLADGRDRKLVTIKGLANAELTPAGVFYAAGRTVTFVPIRAVLQILR